MKYRINYNVGVEWHTDIEAATKEEAEERAYKIWEGQFPELRDYNFDADVVENNL